MNKASKIAAIAGVAIASFLPMAAAGAIDNCVGSSDGCKPNIPTSNGGEDGGEDGGVLPSDSEKPAPAGSPATEGSPAAAEQPQAVTAPSGELPFTGSDVVGLTIIGAGALGLGTVLVRRSKAASSAA